MPVNNPSAASLDTSHQLALVRQLVGEHPQTIDEVAMELWQRLCRSLVMIIGDEGFDALFDRSVHLTSAEFPWLKSADLSQGNPSSFDSLRLRLQQQDPEQALQATVLQLATFTAVLVTLIGQPLTTNLTSFRHLKAVNRAQS
jgi:hypothetical protein